MIKAAIKKLVGLLPKKKDDAFVRATCSCNNPAFNRPKIEAANA